MAKRHTQWDEYWEKIPPEVRGQMLREFWAKWRDQFPGLEEQRRERLSDALKARFASLSIEQRRKKTARARDALLAKYAARRASKRIT